ncbi:MAG: CopD family protein [Flavobacteriales bacterium Tduv]
MSLYSTGFNLVKALHIIFMVSYFSGLFYLVRLFIYHTEALKKSESEKTFLQRQYLLMERLLWRMIVAPGAVFTLIFGLTMLCVESRFYLSSSWMYFKLVFILLLFFYHLGCWKILHELKHGVFRFSGLQLRIWNEVATMLLFAIVLAVVLKRDFVLYEHWIAFGFLILGMLIIVILKHLKRLKDKKSYVGDL